MIPTIGLFVTNFTQPMTRLQRRGVFEGARSRGANLVCFSGGYRLARNGNDAQANIIYDLANSKRLDGLIIWTGGINSFVTPAEIEEFAERYHPLPIVSVEQPIAGFPSVVMDNYGAMRALHGSPHLCSRF